MEYLRLEHFLGRLGLVWQATQYRALVGRQRLQVQHLVTLRLQGFKHLSLARACRARQHLKAELRGHPHQLFEHVVAPGLVAP